MKLDVSEDVSFTMYNGSSWWSHADSLSFRDSWTYWHKYWKQHLKQNIQVNVSVLISGQRQWWPCKKKKKVLFKCCFLFVRFLFIYFIIPYFLFMWHQHQHDGVAQSSCLFVIEQWDSGIEGQIETISHIKSSGNSAQISFIKIRLIFAGVARLKICVCSIMETGSPSVSCLLLLLFVLVNF